MDHTIPKKLTQQEMQDVLMTIYTKGNEPNDFSVQEIIEEIKKSLVTIYSLNSVE
ncbi:hypothetical protein [Halobacillus amylolyticus]|uniref:Uncharacterized protein n=1 Tax=Halobacillus amylolyticus TaxID=2932259 RepID=A0ABY4HHC2_9BACI|nr:hypothetical protein [Halobacillus amylolyticus]UOR13798.1 hypothetical protein MUO15_10330 [Halobacillus amylolyticus]